MHRRLWLLALGVLTTACARRASDEAPCDTVGTQVQTIARTELATAPDLDPAIRRDAELRVGPLKDEIAHACKQHAWSIDVRRCLVGAASGSAMRQCAAGLSPEQRGSLPQKGATP